VIDSARPLFPGNGAPQRIAAILDTNARETALDFPLAGRFGGLGGHGHQRKTDDTGVNPSHFHLPRSREPSSNTSSTPAYERKFGQYWGKFGRLRQASLWWEPGFASDCARTIRLACFPAVAVP